MLVIVVPPNRLHDLPQHKRLVSWLSTGSGKPKVMDQKEREEGQFLNVASGEESKWMLQRCKYE